MLLNFAMVPMLLLVIAPGVSSQDLFGATLRAVDEAGARRLSGYGAAGVAIERVTPGGVAELFELASNDVLLEVNGTRSLRPADVARSIRAATDSNAISYSRGGRKWDKAVTAERLTRVAILVAPEVAEDLENEWLSIGRASGVSFEVTAKFPQALNKYAGIVIVDSRAVPPQSAAKLDEYIKNGGGVVLSGFVPSEIAGSASGRARPRGDSDFKTIAWFGASRLLNSKSRRGNHSLSLAANNPLGTQLRSGEQLFAYVSNEGFAAISDKDLADTTGVIARWTFTDFDLRFVGAFFNRYGEGRVYWQFLPSAPSYPKVQELFIAGIRWAAGVGR